MRRLALVSRCFRMQFALTSRSACGKVQVACKCESLVYFSNLNLGDLRAHRAHCEPLKERFFSAAAKKIGAFSILTD